MIRKQTTEDRAPIAGPGIQMTRQQIADAIGCSRSRVWQIEKAALRKIRDELAKQGISSDDVE